MSDIQQIIVEFVSDTTQLQSGLNKLSQSGKIDQQSAAIFKQTNDQIKQRNDLLEKAKIDADQFNLSVSREQAIYNKLVSSLKSLTGASQAAVKELLKLSPEKVSADFDRAAVSVDEYIKALKTAGETPPIPDPIPADLSDKTESLRSQLRAVTEQIAQLTLAGETNTQEFQDLTSKVGKLKNAMDDARQTVANLGQDVPTLRVFSAGIETISSSFTLATGAAALFGDENEDLQKVLVKVNAVMAVNAGITQILNTLSDEALINTAKTIALQRIKNAQIAIENGLQSESIIVRTGATVAQYALNLAMSLSPLGIITIALAAFVAGIIIYTSNATKAAKAQAELNAALSSAGDLLDAEIQGYEGANKKIIAGLEQRNARQSEIDAQNLSTLKIKNAATIREIANLNSIIEKNQDNTNSDTEKLVKESVDKRNALEKDAFDQRVDIIVGETALRKQQLNEQLEDVVNNVQARLTAATKNSDQEFELRRKLAIAEANQEIHDAGDNANKILAIRAQLARNLKDIDIVEAKVRQDIIAAGLQSALIKAQNASQAINDRQSQEEVDKQKAIILEQAAFDVQQEGLSEKQKQLIRDTANQKALELQRNFDKEAIQNAIQDQISLNNATLEQTNLGEKEKLDLRLQNIVLAASAEIEQNRGKIDKIKEIEAKRDADIRAARLQSIEDTVQKEIQLQTNANAANVRGIEAALAAQDEINNAQGLGGDTRTAKLLGQQKLSTDQQKALIDQLTQFQLDAVNKRIDAANEEVTKGLISYEDYFQKISDLDDQSVKIHEDAEKKKTDITKKEVEKRKAQNEEILKDALQGASDGIGILSQFYQQESDAQSARIDAQRQAIQDLSDAGAITAKEASARNKKLDLEQKQLQVQQAKRQKELDLFQAILNTALAVTNALTSGDPYTAPIRAAIAGALGAAQIALIASRPIPQFGKGKKGRYEGWAEVGETGAELIERKGRMYIQPKRAVMYVEAADKIYNPAETTEILSRLPHNEYPQPIVNINTGKDFDYQRMGREVGKNISFEGMSGDENGMYAFKKSKQGFIKYLGERRKWLSK